MHLCVYLTLILLPEYDQKKSCFNVASEFLVGNRT